MLYGFYFNQFGYVSQGISVSMEAAAVLATMQSKMSVRAFQKEVIKEGDRLYFWFSHDIIIEELPFIFGGTESFDAKSKRLRRIAAELVEQGLIELHPNVKSLKRSYYCLTDKADSLIETDKNVRVRRTNLSESDRVETDKFVRGEYNHIENNTSEKAKPNSSKNFAKEKDLFHGIESIAGVILPLTFNEKIIAKYNEFLSGKYKGKIKGLRSLVALNGEIKRIDLILAETSEEAVIQSIQYCMEKEWSSINQEGFDKEAKRVFMASKKSQTNSYSDSGSNRKYVSW